MSMFYCQPCNKSVPANGLFAHVGGQAHKTSLSEESFDRKMSRSVIVRGISPNLSRENIQSIFVSFGKVESFHYPNKSRDSAIVRFFNVDTVRRVLQGSKNLVFRGCKLHISDELFPLYDNPKTSAGPTPERSRSKDVDPEFIQDRSLHSPHQEWKSTNPESNFEESRNFDRSIQHNLRDKARKSELDGRYQQFRGMHENNFRTDDPVREQGMRRPDHGMLITDNRFNDLNMRNQPASDSYSQRYPKESNMDYRFQNTEREDGRNYMQSASQNREQHITPFHKSQNSDGREMVAGRAPTLPNYMPSRSALERDDMIFRRRDVPDGSRGLDDMGSEFTKEYIPHYHRSSPDRYCRSRSPNTGKRTQENQYQGREMESSSMGRQDLTNTASEYRSKPDIQAHSSDSRMYEREPLRASARECPVRESSISDEGANRDRPRSKQHNQFDDSGAFVHMSKISLKFSASLDLQGDFNQQLSTLMSELSRFEFKPEELKVLCTDIKQVLQHDYEGCRIYLSGSAMTDMALPDSQVHCYAELTENSKMKLKLNSQNEDIMEMATRFTFETLKLHRELFSNIQAFVRRRNPFIVFRHISTGYCVNISFKGGFSVAQSELLNLFLSIDERLTPLFVFIRYWSTVNGILVRNCFSKYCLSLLVIFYLQRLPKPILPSVQFLQDDPSYDIFEDGWNRGFNKTLHKNLKYNNTTNMAGLIEGFFEFYSNFAFDKYVISPFTGLAIPANLFQNLETLPLSLGRYVNYVKNRMVQPFEINNVMNIQDPFQLNCNVSNSVTVRIKKNFQTICQDSFFQFRNCRKNQAYEGLLNTVLNVNRKLSKPQEKKVSKITVPLPVNPLSEESTMLMFVRLNKLFTDAVADVLKCKFTCLKDIKYNNRGSLLSPHVKYTCTAYYNLWSSRNIDQSSFISCIEEEALASDKMIDCLYRNQKPKCPILVFTLEASIELEAKCIQFFLSCEDGDTKTFREFGDFLGPILEVSVKKLVELI